MITRLLFKLGFKAVVPIVASLGLISYMSYTQGGDPLAYARMMLGNASSSGPSSLERASGSVTGTFAAIYDKTSGSINAVNRHLSTGDGEQPAIGAANEQYPNNGSTVYRWKDAAGNTHFGSHPDENAVDIVPISVSKGRSSSSSDSNTASRTSNSNNSVPGMPDIKLPGGIKLPEGIDYRRLTGQIDIPD